MKTIPCAVFFLAISSFAYSRNLVPATREHSPADFGPIVFPISKEDLTRVRTATDSTAGDDLDGLARMKTRVSTQSSKPNIKEKENEVPKNFQKPSLLVHPSVMTPIQDGIAKTHKYSSPIEAKATSKYSDDSNGFIFPDYQEDSMSVVSKPSQFNLYNPSDKLLSRSPATKNNHKEMSDKEAYSIPANTVKSTTENSITNKHVASSTATSRLTVKENNNNKVFADVEDYSVLVYPTLESAAEVTSFDTPRHQTHQHMETSTGSISTRFSATENAHVAFPDVEYYSTPVHPVVESTTKVRITDKRTQQWIKIPKRASNQRYSITKNEEILSDVKHSPLPVLPEQTHLHISTTSVPNLSRLTAIENKNASPPEFEHYLIPYSPTESSVLKPKIIVDNPTPHHIQTLSSRSVITKDDTTPLTHFGDGYRSNLLISSPDTTTPVTTPYNLLSTGPTDSIPDTATITKNNTDVSTNVNPVNTTNARKTSLEISAKDIIMVIVGDLIATEPDSRKNSTSGIEEKGYTSGELVDIRFITDYATRDCSVENYCYAYGECRECS